MSYKSFGYANISKESVVLLNNERKQDICLFLLLINIANYLCIY